MIIRNGGRWFDFIIKSEVIRNIIWFPVIWLLTKVTKKAQGSSMRVCICMLSRFIALCDRMDGSPPGSSVRRILQARILEWVAMPSFRTLPEPEIKPGSLLSPALTGGFFTSSTTQKPTKGFESESDSCSVVWVFVTLWTVTARLLSPWNSPGKNTAVGDHFLLREIFPTQG